MLNCCPLTHFQIGGLRCLKRHTAVEFNEPPDHVVWSTCWSNKPHDLMFGSRLYTKITPFWSTVVRIRSDAHADGKYQTGEDKGLRKYSWCAFTITFHTLEDIKILYHKPQSYASNETLHELFITRVKCIAIERSSNGREGGGQVSTTR